MGPLRFLSIFSFVSIFTTAISVEVFAQTAPAAAPSAPGTESPAPAASPPSPDAESPGAAPATQPYYDSPPPPAPPPAASPGIYVETPPPAPLQPRTRHFHDGFYLRLSGGFGALGVSSDAGTYGETTVAGEGFALDLLLGGTPSPGLVIGGGLLLQDAFQPRYKGAATDENDALLFTLFGPMIDVFPSPSSGFHFGALLGLASLGVTDDKDNNSGGLGLSLWTGYMWWASSEWSIGGLVRFSGARTARSLSEPDVDIDDTTRSLAIMFSAAYH
jgi:hypothetical protein